MLGRASNAAIAAAFTPPNEKPQEWDISESLLPATWQNTTFLHAGYTASEEELISTELPADATGAIQSVTLLGEAVRLASGAEINFYNPARSGSLNEGPEWYSDVEHTSLIVFSVDNWGRSQIVGAYTTDGIAGNGFGVEREHHFGIATLQRLRFSGGGGTGACQTSAYGFTNGEVYIAIGRASTITDTVDLFMFDKNGDLLEQAPTVSAPGLNLSASGGIKFASVGNCAATAANRHHEGDFIFQQNLDIAFSDDDILEWAKDPFRFIRPDPSKVIPRYVPAAASGTTLGTATETDTALPLTGKRVSTLGVASETDSAIALTGKRVTTLGVAIETDAALRLFSGDVEGSGDIIPAWLRVKRVRQGII